VGGVVIGRFYVDVHCRMGAGMCVCVCGHADVGMWVPSSGCMMLMFVSERGIHVGGKGWQRASEGNGECSTHPLFSTNIGVCMCCREYSGKKHSGFHCPIAARQFWLTPHRELLDTWFSNIHVYLDIHVTCNRMWRWSCCQQQCFDY
jgi:hypothetical protein